MQINKTRKHSPEICNSNVCWFNVETLTYFTCYGKTVFVIPDILKSKSYYTVITSAMWSTIKTWWSRCVSVKSSSFKAKVTKTGLTFFLNLR